MLLETQEAVRRTKAELALNEADLEVEGKELESLSKEQLLEIAVDAQDAADSQDAAATVSFDAKYKLYQKLVDDVKRKHAELQVVKEFLSGSCQISAATKRILEQACQLTLTEMDSLLSEALLDYDGAQAAVNAGSQNMLAEREPTIFNPVEPTAP
eukprot:gene31329-37858_t